MDVFREKKALGKANLLQVKTTAVNLSVLPLLESQYLKINCNCDSKLSYMFSYLSWILNRIYE